LTDTLRKCYEASRPIYYSAGIEAAVQNADTAYTTAPVQTFGRAAAGGTVRTRDIHLYSL